MPHVHLFRLDADGQENGSPPAEISQFPSVIGRKSCCDYVLDDPLVSRRHCRLTLREDAVWAEDLCSRNGTRLNGLFLADPRTLADGDRLELAHLSFRVRLRESEKDKKPEAPGRQVLVVEDDESTAMSLAWMLQSWGHKVQVALDGPEALAVARATPPEIVLLDIGLPSMSGLEVARQLRADDSLRETRLVALTGDQGATEVLKSRESFAQLLVKPVSPRLLRAALGTPAAV